MAKYIDLLRAHQHTDTSIASSQPVEHSNTDESAELLLPNESEPSAQTTTSHDDLLTEEIEKSDHYVATMSSPSSDESHIQRHIDDWLSHCVQHVLLIFQHAAQNTPADISPLSQSISALLAQLEDGEQQDIIDALELNISQQTQTIRLCDADLGSLVQKAILMMLYSIKAGQRLKLNPDELRAYILAAMLHHIGMTQVPSDIRNKKQRLNKGELDQIRQAPHKGHHFLEQSNITDPSILQAASQASERYDGSGTHGISGTDIAWSARLTSVLSMFEALIHYRPYRARLLPRDAIREIVKHHKKSFDPTMLKALIESISLYPIGTYVQLNSGEIGLVSRIHPRLPLRPIVNIQMDLQGNKIPPRQVDLKSQPNLTIEKCMYEESLAELKNQ